MLVTETFGLADTLEMGADMMRLGTVFDRFEFDEVITFVYYSAPVGTF
jgi:hypothetical protein